MYNRLFDKTQTAIDYAESNNLEGISSILTELEDIQLGVRKIDDTLAPLTTPDEILANRNVWDKRLQLMREILVLHQDKLPLLHSIVAVQRAELAALRKGMRGISGYQSGTNTSGRLIKNSS